jgi:hypothetical protein
MAKPKVTVKTGETVEKSGQYHPSGGGNLEITLVKGKTAPPNNSGERPIFTLIDETKHKGK